MKNRINMGFTILETVIAIGILGVVSLAILQIYISTQTTFYVQEARTSLQSDTRYSLDRINSWIKQSSSVISTYTASDDTVYNTDENELILKVPSVDANSNVINNKFDYLVFFPDTTDSTLLQQITYPDATSSRDNNTKIISDHLSSVAFVYYNSSGNQIMTGYEDSVIIKTNISTEEVVRGNTLQVQLNTESKLRNK